MTNRFVPSRTWLRSLKRRHCKKLRLGEFQEFGLEVKLTFAPALDEAKYEEFFVAFVDMLEEKGLLMAGLGGSFPLAESEAFICCDARGTVSDALAQELLGWLKARPEVSTATGELLDAWYGW